MGSDAEDSSSSPNSDSRKRKLEDDDDGKSMYKKANQYHQSVCHFKMLVPGVSAGAILGKGGETIAQLQIETGTRVRMSKANDFYPGTTERVCLISGAVDAILKVLEFILKRIREKPEHNLLSLTANDTKQKSERDRQVKILVPNSTASKIIGKGGNYVKQIKEESGAFIMLSQKEKDQQLLQERCVTIMGETENNLKACSLILAKIQEDPQSGSCSHVSYADVTYPVANPNPTGSPYAGAATRVGGYPSEMFVPGTVPGAYSSSSVLSVLGTSAATPDVSALSSINAIMDQLHGYSAPQIVESVRGLLRATAFSEPAIAEISVALNTLAKYGLLGLGLRLGGLASVLNGSHSAAGIPQVAYATANTLTAVPTSTGEALTFIGNPAAQNPAENSLVSAVPDLSKSQIEVNESLVGAILGPGGKSLVDIQFMSGATINISKKGDFAPGTKNRIVTISGSGTAVHVAQLLIQQRIKEAKLKRHLE